MKLKRITVINHLTGWNVRDLFFDDYLTLLVGASGVGKTLILRVIKNISNIANGGSYNGLEWDITFEDSGNTYQWTGKFDTADDSSSYFRRDKQEYPIICESLRRGDNLIISRENDQIMFNDKQTVKLDTAKSAIALLKEEDEIIKELSNFSGNETLLQHLNEVFTNLIKNSMSFTLSKFYFMRKIFEFFFFKLVKLI